MKSKITYLLIVLLFPVSVVWSQPVCFSPPEIAHMREVVLRAKKKMKKLKNRVKYLEQKIKIKNKLIKKIITLKKKEWEELRKAKKLKTGLIVFSSIMSLVAFFSVVGYINSRRKNARP